MWIVLVMGCLIPLVYIGYLMSKLDKFIAEGGVGTENNEIYPVAIVLGETELAKELAKLLEKSSISIFPLTEPFLLEREQNLRYLFALSDNDADNIVLCKIGKKLYNIEKMISICNDRRNVGMFMSEKIVYMTSDEVTAQMLYQAVIQVSEVIY